MHSPLRLRCDSSALAENFDNLQREAGVPAGAAVKADGYGLGVQEVSSRLWAQGCRDFFVSTWREAAGLSAIPQGSVAVLHGVGPDDDVIPGVRPVLNSAAQIARWKECHPEPVACDVMVDTGMNRLGLRLNELALLDGLNIHTLHSHLACADEPHSLNDLQLQRFRDVAATVGASRYSLSNSAGIFLGRDYSFDLVRPGLALYGGIPVSKARATIKAVAKLEAQIVQLRPVPAGETIGYNATFRAQRPMNVAILNIGYADGYWRSFSEVGQALFEDSKLPVVGRVSMDLVAIDAGNCGVREGDWVTLDFDLERASEMTGMSQYELLTGLGQRLERVWF